MNTMFPVLIYEEGMDLPKEGTYFLVSGNGLWMHKDTGIVHAFVPVDNIAILDNFDAETTVECSLPKVPAGLVWQIKMFFKEVVQRHHSEANVLLFYSKVDEAYKAHVPLQHVSHGGVQYIRAGTESIDGMGTYLRVGTIHSHCDFGAFHSGTDVGDEEDFDGLHCTFGHNDKDEFAISVSVVVNGYRHKVNPELFLSGIELVGGEHYKLLSRPSFEDNWLTEWLSQVKTGWLLPGKPAEDGIFQGDKVTWSGDLATVSFKTMCGEGPFEVMQQEQGCITINTKVGLARFSDKLFRKV